MTIEARELQAILEALAPDAVDREVRPLTGGVSATTLLLTVRAAAGEVQRFVVRHRPKETSRGRLSPDAEAALMTSLHERGLPVPRPLLRWSPDTFIMTWSPGDVRMPPHGPTSSAEALARIHQQEGPFVEALPALEDPTTLLERELTSAGITLPVRELMGQAPIDRCLLHGDFWPANLLWERGRLTAILDWEHAAIGDPLSDVACARVEFEVAEGREAARTFTDRYLELSGREASRLSWWDLYVSAAALESMGTWGLSPEVFAHRWAVTQRFRDRAVETLSERFGR
ncbi:MAG TPA: phosphotransferase [Myxococcaceae bacterium]|nr:phosphotransferase [Myxococcaceae bacterium]